MRLSGGLLRASALGLWWLVACNGGPPAPPPSTTSIPPPEPTTSITEIQPNDYITLERAGNCIADPDSKANTGLCRELFHEIQENASRGWRDFLVLVERCPWSLQPNDSALFPITAEEAEAIAMVGAQLDSEGWGFITRLGEVNRRCEEQPRFCGRSNVRKDRFSNEDDTGYRDRLFAHLDYSRELRSYLNGQPGEGESWDSLAGWCNSQ